MNEKKETNKKKIYENHLNFFETKNKFSFSPNGFYPVVLLFNMMLMAMMALMVMWLYCLIYHYSKSSHRPHQINEHNGFPFNVDDDDDIDV